MRAHGLIFILFLISASLKSQDIYKGGAGDGADMAELQNISLSIEENSKLDLVKIYPTLNSQGFLNIESRVSLEYFICDLKGTEHKSGLLSGGINSLDISGLSEGFYFIQLRNHSKEHIRKLVILK